MTDKESDARIVERAGSALFWQGVHHFGVKAIYLARIPILARLLSPDDFGLMAIAAVSVDLLLQLTDFGVIPALVQRSSSDDRHYHTAWTIGLLRALAVSGTVFVAAPVIAGFFAEPRAGVIVQVLALRPILQALASIRAADLTRNLEFRGIAALYLTEALTTAAVSIALAPFWGVWGLVAGSLIGPAAYTILSYVLAPYRPLFSLHGDSASSLVRFGRWIFLTGIVAIVGSAGLQAVISRTLGTVELGLYFLAAKLAFLPTEVASELVGGVAFPMYARMQEDAEQARRAFRFVLTGTVAVLLPVLGLLIGLAPSLVHEILGARWDGSAPVIQVLAVAGALGLFANAASSIFKGVGVPSRVTVYRAAQGLVLVVGAWLLAGRFGLVGAAAAWIPATALALVITVAMMVSLLPGVLAGLATPALVVLAIASASGLLAYGVDALLPGMAGLVAGGGAGTGLACVLLWSVDRRLGLHLGRIVSRVLPTVSGALGRGRGEARAT